MCRPSLKAEAVYPRQKIDRPEKHPPVAKNRSGDFFCAGPFAAGNFRSKSLRALGKSARSAANRVGSFSFAEVEVRDGTTTKYYFAGGLRIAGRVVAPSTTASAGDLLAGAPFRGITLSPGVAVGLALVLLLLLLSPGLRGDSRWRVLLVPTRAFATAAFFWLALLPPGLAKAALPGDVTLWHYHLDHLGTTHSITDASGNLYRQTRTTAYGEVRGRYDGSGNIVAAEVALRHEFTGYQSEEKSGLQYAGARYYLPELGVFTSHDPAGQFPSPYAYGPGDPINGTDPTGEDFLGIVLLVISIVAAVARFIYTGVTTGKWGAAGFGLVVSLAMIAAFYHAGPPIAAGIEELAGETVAAAIGYAQVGYTTYGFANSIRKGDAIGAVTAAPSLATTAYGFASDQSGSSTSKVVSGQGKEGPTGIQQALLEPPLDKNETLKDRLEKWIRDDLFPQLKPVIERSKDTLLKLAHAANGSASIIVGQSRGVGAGHISVTLDASGNLSISVGLGIGVGKLSAIFVAIQGRVQGGEVGWLRQEFTIEGTVTGVGVFQSSVVLLTSPGAAVTGGLLFGRGYFGFIAVSANVPVGNVSGLLGRGP